MFLRFSFQDVAYVFSWSLSNLIHKINLLSLAYVRDLLEKFIKDAYNAGFSLNLSQEKISARDAKIAMQTIFTK